MTYIMKIVKSNTAWVVYMYVHVHHIHASNTHDPAGSYTEPKCEIGGKYCCKFQVANRLTHVLYIDDIHVVQGWEVTWRPRVNQSSSDTHRPSKPSDVTQLRYHSF